MLYVTGDLHGDETRLRVFSRRLFKKHDVLLVCGDFGFVWDGGAEEKKRLAALEKLDCTIFFIEGTHDNLDLLAQYPEETFCGGTVRRVGKNLLWMQRGEIYTIEGRSVFALGGAESPDADERIEGVSWWKNEQPTLEELRRGAENLRRAGYVDLILTHQSPCDGLGLIGEQTETVNAQKVFLRRLAGTELYGHWYFGGSHLDRQISPRMTAVFEKLVPAFAPEGLAEGKKKK